MKTKKTTHTPGPWEVDGRGVVRAVGYRLILAKIQDNADRDGNSLLIAASPDLLAACKAFNDAINFGNRGATFEAQVLVRAAIAKAEGGK